MRRNTYNLLLLTGIFCLGLLTSNLFGGKLINIMGFTIAGAVLTYPLTFLTTDIVGEVWGKEEANQCVKVGVIIQIGFIILGYLTCKIPTLPQCEKLNSALHLVLNQGVRMTVASMGAFLCSQFLDIYIFHNLKDKYNGKHKWLRNNVSTMTSQLIDTIIFTTIAFYGVIDNLVLTIIVQYIVKLILAALDTPFFYFFTRRAKI